MELRHQGLHRGRAGNTKRTGAPHWREVGAGARRVGWWSWSYRQAAASSMMESWCTCLWLFHAYDSFCLQEHQKRIYQVWYEKVRYSNGPFRSVSIFPFLSENGSDVACILETFAYWPSGVSISWSSSSHDTICSCWYVKKTCMAVKLQYYCNSSWQEKWWWMSSKNCFTFALFHNLVSCLESLLCEAS